MNLSTFKDRFMNAARILNGTLMPSNIAIIGEWDIEVVRHDGRRERKTVRNTVTAAGLNRIANRAVQATGTSVFFYICVGSTTAAPALTDVQSNMGEILRKSFVATGASAQSREWIFGVCTFGGAADGVTSLTLNCAGIFDHANSHATTGVLGNRVNGLGVTLGNSDFLNLTVRMRVGSHDVSHTT
jgi:hypothetical protein